MYVVGTKKKRRREMTEKTRNNCKCIEKKIRTTITAKTAMFEREKSSKILKYVGTYF